MLGLEIIKEIDETLDQLISNAQLIDSCALNDLEKESFEKTQEDLVHHFLFLDDKLKDKRERIAKKMYEKLIELRKYSLPKCSNKIIRFPKTRRPKRKVI